MPSASLPSGTQGKGAQRDRSHAQTALAVEHGEDPPLARSEHGGTLAA
jgi:hypothetical protein